MNEFLHQPGFLGTNANRAADITLVIMLLAATLFTIGFILARKKNFKAHRWVQTSAATLNAIMVLWMMILPYRDFVLRGKAGSQPAIFYTMANLHAGIGLIAITFGLFVTLRGNGLVPKPLQFRNYKLYMRTAYGLYMLATLLGVLVYLTWFVIVPNQPVY
jgi:uncharacterized membrane protein YozB (DUF420 family)